MAELLAGVGILLLGEWAGDGPVRDRTVWWGLVAACWLAEGQPIPALALAAVVALQWLSDAEQACRERAGLVRWSKTVALLASSGLPLLQSVEEASRTGAVPDGLLAIVHRLGTGVRNVVERFIARHDPAEGRQVAHWLEAVWAHGLDPAAAREQGLLMWERLQQEERLREARGPLWTAALPGIMLLVALLVFLVPLGSFLVAGWAAP